MGNYSLTVSVSSALIKSYFIPNQKKMIFSIKCYNEAFFQNCYVLRLLSLHCQIVTGVCCFLSAFRRLLGCLLCISSCSGFSPSSPLCRAGTRCWPSGILSCCTVLHPFFLFLYYNNNIPSVKLPCLLIKVEVCDFCTTKVTKQNSK